MVSAFFEFSRPLRFAERADINVKTWVVWYSGFQLSSIALFALHKTIGVINIKNIQARV